MTNYYRLLLPSYDIQKWPHYCTKCGGKIVVRKSKQFSSYYDSATGALIQPNKYYITLSCGKVKWYTLGTSHYDRSPLYAERVKSDDLDSNIYEEVIND